MFYTFIEVKMILSFSGNAKSWLVVNPFTITYLFVYLYFPFHHGKNIIGIHCQFGHSFQWLIDKHFRRTMHYFWDHFHRQVKFVAGQNENYNWNSGIYAASHKGNEKDGWRNARICEQGKFWSNFSFKTIPIPIQ